MIIALFVLYSCGETKQDQEVAKKVEVIKDEISQESVNSLPKSKKELQKEELPLTHNETNVSKKEDGFMKKIGFSSKDGTISLDTNKAKDYLHDLGDEIKDKSQKISKDIKEKTLTVTKDIGIAMDRNGSLTIDTNKTKSFMKNMGEKMENIAKDVDKFVREVVKDKNITR